MKNIILISVFLMLPVVSRAQSDFQNLLKSGEILVNGLSFIKGNKTKTDAKTIETFCVKNKLSDKITFKLVGKDIDGADVTKELVIQKEGRECIFNLPKGVWAYEIDLANKDVYKKGEYKIDDELVINVKD